jgi:hypothetical protein
MASAELSRRVRKVVGHPPLSEMNDLHRREFHEAVLDADAFEDLPAAILKAGAAPPQLRMVSGDHRPARQSVREDRAELDDSLVRILRKPLACGESPSQFLQGKPRPLEVEPAQPPHDGPLVPGRGRVPQ